jgi:SAM-dependent methyltransferase
MMDQDLEKIAQRGAPSYMWRKGQERRFEMIKLHAGDHLFGKVLDIGCGLGAYLERLAKHADRAYGIEFEFSRAKSAQTKVPTLTCAAGEDLPFLSDQFDLILSHEVLEHVHDDRACLEESVRLLRQPGADHSGGRLILFIPNRGYPFETHGVYWRGTYHFGNIPLINYLPKQIRDRLAPHVRVYSRKDIDQLFVELPVRIIHRTVLFGAYDNIIARSPVLGKAIRGLLHFLERTPLKVFGLSHFWVVERI